MELTTPYSFNMVLGPAALDANRLLLFGFLEVYV
jgi:hypothetical protein